MTRILAFLWCILLTSASNAQGLTDKKNIDKLCGCFDVEFKYAETFAPDPYYKFHDREAISGGTELTYPVEVSDRKIVMQHLLIITDSMIVKHWREDWTFESPVRWIYEGDNVWTKKTLKPEDVKGKWTQSVWEVSDAPRYQGSSDWFVGNGTTFWLSTADAPLPRREYSTRSDYNILRRTNRLIINDKGYVHEQDNQKIIRKDGFDKLLAEEKGLNTYVRVPDIECAAGKAYWESTKAYWTSVRVAWERYLASHDRVELKGKIDGKVLHDHLFDLAKDFSTGKMKQVEIDSRIKEVLDKYLGSESKTFATK